MNSAVITQLLDPQYMGAMYFSKDPVAFAKGLLEDGCYSSAGTEFYTALQGEAAAEYAFDLSNNPARQDERNKIYGRRRSISVGDVVIVDGVRYLCAPAGWKII